MLALLRHATATDPHGHGERAEDQVDAIVRTAVREKARPVFEAAVELLERLQRAGRVAEDVDVRHLGISALAMTWAPVVDEGIVRSLWPVDLDAPSFVSARRTEVVRTLLARLTDAPPSRHGMSERARARRRVRPANI